MPPVTSFPIGIPSGQQPKVHVYDTTAGQSLYELNADTVFDYAASTTKLMTALLAWEYKSSVLDSETVTFTSGDVAQPIPPFTLDMAGFDSGDVVTWRSVLAGLLLPSSTECCQAIARVIGTELFVAAGSTGSTGRTRFIERMNARAAELSLSTAVFENEYGGSKTFSPTTVRNQISARDLSTLCVLVMSHADMRSLAGSPTYDIVVTGGRGFTLTVSNYNRFVNGPTASQTGYSDANVRGGKNGVWSLPDDGVFSFSLTQIYTAPGGNEIVMTLLGSKSLRCLMLDARGLIFSFLKDWPYLELASPPGDANFASVQVLVGYDGSIVDEAQGRTVTVSSITVGDPLVNSTGGGVANAESDFATVPDAAALRIGSTSATAEGFIAGPGTASSNERVVFCKWDSGADKREWLVEFFDHTFSFYLSTLGTSSITGANILSLTDDERATMANGAPHHLALQKSGSLWSAYFDGEIGTQTQSVGTIFAGSAALNVAGFAAGSSGWVGSYDDFRFTAGVARYSGDMTTIRPSKFPRAAVSPPPPPPPASPPTSQPYVSVRPRLAAAARFSTAAKFSGAYSIDSPSVVLPGEGATDTPQAYPFHPGPRRDGPFRLLGPVPTHYDYQVNPPEPPAATVEVPPWPMHGPNPGPWQRLSFGRLMAPVPNPFATVPPPPASPPPPPPPGSVLGPSRQQVLQVARAPRAGESGDETARLRQHADRVAGIVNSLLRRGNIRQVGANEFEVIASGFSEERAPGATDDSSVGVVVGSLFVNRLDSSVFICVNNSVASAVWRQLL